MFSLPGLQAIACGLLLFALSTTHPATAAVPQHQQKEPAGITQVEPAEQVPPVQTAESEEEIGLDEQLGAYLPLDLVFRDEQGNPVSLSELVTKPTIIAPVYYRCPNVCHFLQGDLARVLPGIKLKAGEDY